VRDLDDSGERSVPPNDSVEDLMEQTITLQARSLLAWINRHGPTTIRRFIDDGGFNYTTIKPVLDELVEKGLLKKDEKPRARPGNPVYFHLTPDGVSLVVVYWTEMSVIERVKATHIENLQDLGVIEDLKKYDSQQLSSRQREAANSFPIMEALAPYPGVSPEFYAAYSTPVSSEDPILRNLGTQAYWGQYMYDSGQFRRFAATHSSVSIGR
jgi:DNA-binding PadR family transcriptional regulator